MTKERSDSESALKKKYKEQMSKFADAKDRDCTKEKEDL